MSQPPTSGNRLGGLAAKFVIAGRFCSERKLEFVLPQGWLDGKLGSVAPELWTAADEEELIGTDQLRI
jgi:hypothetical protein